MQELVARFRSHATQVTSTCSPRECSVRVIFENTWLRKLHLATWTSFATNLMVRDGQLYYVSTGMKLYTRDRVIGAESTLMEPREGWLEPFRVVTQGDDSRPPSVIIVHFTPQATQSEREAAFAFNLSCLDELGGCKHSSDLLPSVWRDNREQSDLLGTGSRMPHVVASKRAQRRWRLCLRPAGRRRRRQCRRR